MKTSIHKAMASILAVILALTVVLAPTPASARWHSSDIDDASKTSDILMYGALACAGAAIIIAFATHDGKPADNTAEGSKRPEPAKADAAVTTTAPHQKPATATTAVDTTTVVPVKPEKDSRLNLYIGLTNDKALYRNDEPAMDLSDYSVRAGVTFGF